MTTRYGGGAFTGAEPSAASMPGQASGAGEAGQAGGADVAGEVGRAGVGQDGPLGDATLVARARDGDTRAFETLVRRYQRPIYRLAIRMLDDSGEAEDVTQEVFVTAWRRLPQIHEEKAVRSWLYRIATNRCLNILRSRKPVTPLVEEAISVASPAASPEARAEAHERLLALRVALDRLTAEQRACWLLREMEELSYAEIASILRTTPQAVRGRLARARADLGEAMISWR